MPLVEASFVSGSLRSESHARPGQLFTASRDLMVAEVGSLRPEVYSRLVEAVVTVLRGK